MTALPVTVEDASSLRLLQVEDDDDFAALVAAMFRTNPDYAATLDRVDSLSAGIEWVGAAKPDAVLLDLSLPDSDGLATAKRMLDVVEAPTAVVVFTAVRDQSQASQALALGAQDYIVKEDLTPQLVTRVVRYGVTRAQLQHELDSARAGQERERELRRLERMGTEQGGTMSVSAAMLGDRSVAERLGSRYDEELVEEYLRILELLMEEQAYRVDRSTSEDLRSLAVVLGFLGAGPRDVIELHTRAMRRLTAEADAGRAAGAVEEGRVAVLQLMGRLVGYYRERAIGSTRSSVRTAVRDDSDKDPS